MEHLSFTLTGVSPLVQHNGRLADPIDDWSKAIKRISGKRNKTDADHEEIGRLEWHGSLYTDNSHVCIPGEIVEATLVNAAKKQKRGPQARIGLICDGNFPLLYDGPQTIEELWASKAFALRRAMTVNRAKVMRTLPIFPAWAVHIVLMYDPKQLNKSEVEQFVQVAGESIGFMEFRPRFGRFTLS